ncbi:MAG: hypothetical protein ACK5Q5_22690 [Planctomycetaceae bacterium]
MLDGTEYECRSLPVDTVAWERKTKKSFVDGGTPTAEYMLFVCWCAAKREGHTSEPFDNWLTQLADYEEEEESTDPTRTAPTSD